MWFEDERCKIRISLQRTLEEMTNPAETVTTPEKGAIAEVELGR
jgi:hypothetical protein